MTREAFEKLLRDFLHREPFQPFVVELESGQQVEIAEPTAAFSEGFAGYLSPIFEIT
jgi:hypothetical protein